MLPMKKKILLSVFVFTFLIICLSMTVFAARKYSLIVNGSPIKGEAMVIDGITYVPMRSVIEKLGGTYHVMPDLDRISILGKDTSMNGGHDESNPLNFGSKGYIAINKGSDQFIAEISVAGKHSGRDAWKNYQQINDPPPKGFTYYFVKVNFKVLSVEEPGTKVTLDYNNFFYIDSKTQELVPSIPLSLDYIVLGERETFSDWVGFLIPENEQIETIFYSKFGKKTNAIWMKV